MAFIDVEAAVCEYLEPVAQTVTESGDIGGEESYPDPPFIIVSRVGGGADRQGVFDFAQVEINCIGVNRSGSYSLNSQVRQLMNGQSAIGTSYGLIDFVTEDTAPTEIPYGLEQIDIRRATSTWIVSSRAL